MAESTPPKTGRIMSKYEFAGVGALVQLAGVACLLGIPYVAYHEMSSNLRYMLQPERDRESALIPWLVAGIVACVILWAIGSKLSKVLTCSECGNRLTSDTVKMCPTCLAKFGSTRA